MNLTNQFNFSNISYFGKECVGDMYYSAECLHKNFCPQFNEYYVNTGIFIVLLYIIGTWLNKWFFSSGYKMIPYEGNKDIEEWIGDLNSFEVRQYWCHTIDLWLANGLLIFSAIVIFLNI